MSSASSKPPQHRVGDAQRTLEQRFANPFLRWLLRSPFHPLASRWFVLLSYVGPKSGRRYTFPVAYARDGDGVVVVTPKADSNWWKNFRTPTTCRLWYRGARRAAVGAVVTGEGAIELLDTYASTHGYVARSLGVSDEPEEYRTSLEETAKTLAVVRFSFG
ncbi:MULTISPECIES: nitroreductase/quinone reductase family protein [Haloferax]|uniref:DUF385 domain-containing protein n=1 Tax=Haloferax marinum TaxID=2666143 RepID=A0A6A8G4D0_9EURY|nr:MULTISPECIES: nitroreductase/quinone reductase family protein [Haloferax]KAB1196649.1 DUF385 domain-containing protein [Haloferax sp. CBA1150]MRW95655.1 DUF385 domain-containing protein [Haloferax marinum]